jgi:hypothetical protein
MIECVKPEHAAPGTADRRIEKSNSLFEILDVDSERKDRRVRILELQVGLDFRPPIARRVVTNCVGEELGERNTIVCRAEAIKKLAVHIIRRQSYEGLVH